jgi:hypothetical protein
MLSRLTGHLRRSAHRVGIAYLRVPEIRVDYARPFSGRIAVPYLRIPSVQLKIYRPFRRS